MEHLLRDGGDLDSMDRSLVDYNHSQKIVNNTSGHAPLPPPQNNGGSPHNGHALNSNSPPQTTPLVQVNNVDLLSPSSGAGAAISISPATPLPTPILSPEDCPPVMPPVIKRDLVVRFTEQQNSVKCETMKSGASSSSSSGRGHNNENHVTPSPLMYKEQYEVQHYSRHPHGPASPCDSENSVCNRSRENLILGNDTKSMPKKDHCVHNKSHKLFQKSIEKQPKPDTKQWSKLMTTRQK